MEGFSKIDIFATKGIEYLFVIGYLVILILIWRLSTRQVALKRQIREVLGILSANVLRIPQGIFYSRNHTWAHLEESGAARVGMDDLLQHVTGEVQFNGLKTPGEIIRQGDLLTEIHRDGKHLRIFSPISGEILDTNEDLAGSPGLVNEDPYRKGWIYRIKPANWKTETSTCYLAEEATSWAEKELERFKDFLAVSMKKHAAEPSMVVLQDGGELVDNALAHLPSGVWKDFQQEFLANPA